jgi:DNA-binding transcriptional ArsR family regulator
MLGEGEMTVGQLAEPFRVTLPAMSQHLQVLRAAQIVRDRRQGRQRLYRLNPRPLRAVADWALNHADMAETGR